MAQFLESTPSHLGVSHFVEGETTRQKIQPRSQGVDFRDGLPASGSSPDSEHAALMSHRLLTFTLSEKRRSTVLIRSRLWICLNLRSTNSAMQSFIRASSIWWPEPVIDIFMFYGRAPMGVSAVLPFTVEQCWSGPNVQYVVTKIDSRFSPKYLGVGAIVTPLEWDTDRALSASERQCIRRWQQGSLVGSKHRVPHKSSDQRVCCTAGGVGRSHIRIEG